MRFTDKYAAHLNAIREMRERTLIGEAGRACMRGVVILLLLAVTVAALPGCAEIAAMRSGVAEHGADAADQTLDTAIWTMCNAVPVGAVKRRFKTAEERAAYNTLCPEGELP